MMNYIQFDSETKYINDFIKFNQRLYSKNNSEDSKEIKSIIEERHPLSKYFKIYKYLIYEKNEVVGRFAITNYPNDDTAYIGFFECIDKSDVAKFIFDIAKKFAKENGFKRIIGPVDASFWLKYRLKINMFDKRPYTGEPYNKDYYYKMFLNNDYKVIEHYTSNIYRVIEDNYENEKYLKRYNKYIEKGFIIKDLDINQYDQVIKELYFLLTDLYKNFPIYKSIDQKDFIEIFKKYKMILNTSMVKLAYYKDEMVGFFISLPNYSNLVYNINILKLLNIIKIRKNPKEYIMLYVGAKKEYPGLGTGMTYQIINELKKNKLPSIGALTRDQKVTQNYASDLLTERYEYVLMELELND